MNLGDGINGTDDGADDGKVTPLFADRPTAAGLPPQPGVIADLERLLEEARSGKITGIAIVAFNEGTGHKYGTSGKVPYTLLLGAVESLKFEILAKGYVPK